MVHRPLPTTLPCPNCGKQPTVRTPLFGGMQAACSCGVAGPFVQKREAWPEHEALALWSTVAGKPPRPAPPAAIDRRCDIDSEFDRRVVEAVRRATANGLLNPVRT